MTTVQRVAQIFGAIFILVAILGFVATGMNMEADPVRAPHVVGLFAVNVLHNVVHLLFGVLGIMASRGAIMAASAYFQMVAVSYGLLTVLGLIPATQTTFGLIPIWGNDVWLHAALAAGAAYFGFVAPGPSTRRL